MSGLQKAIDEAYYKDAVWGFTKLKPKGHIFTPEQLKSLLEQVAKEQRRLCLKNWSKPNHDIDKRAEFIDAKRIQSAPLATDNLTFNED